MKTNSIRKYAAVVGSGFVLVALMALPRMASAAGSITDANVAEKAAAATTAADHEALAAYFKEKAVQEGKTVERHQSMLNRMRTGRGEDRTFRSHCRRLIDAARASQDAYEDLAEEEAAIAKVLAK